MTTDPGWNLDKSRRPASAQPYRKRHRIGSSSKLALLDQDALEITERVEKTRRGNCSFDDASTADVLLNFTWKRSSSPEHIGTSDGQMLEDGLEEMTLRVHLHSSVLVQSGYFAALLSKRWQESRLKHGRRNSLERDNGHEPVQINMTVPPTREVSSYVTTVRLLYSGDFSGVILDIQTSLSILPVAAELLFDECIAACVSFLEAVPWSKDDEKNILQVISHLQLEEASNLLARLGPVKDNAVEEMLNGLVHAATHSPQNISVSVKTFVARMLSDHGSRETVRLVLEKAFTSSLKTVKDSVEEYSNPNVRGRYDEIEALQRQNLHTAVVNGRSLLWLVERMIELRVAKFAVTEWSEQDVFTANLKRAFSDDTWRNIAPGLPALVLRCTCRLATAVAAGSIIASSQVRLKLVNDWLPVLIVSRENAISATQNKQLHQELEDVFLRIILTLPILDAQNLLQQCLSFATRSVEDCPHLVSAFNTWFRRASQESAFLSEDEVDQVS